MATNKWRKIAGTSAIFQLLTSIATFYITSVVCFSGFFLREVYRKDIMGNRKSCVTGVFTLTYYGQEDKYTSGAIHVDQLIFMILYGIYSLLLFLDCHFAGKLSSVIYSTRSTRLAVTGSKTLRLNSAMVIVSETIFYCFIGHYIFAIVDIIARILSIFIMSKFIQAEGTGGSGSQDTQTTPEEIVASVV